MVNQTIQTLLLNSTLVATTSTYLLVKVNTDKTRFQPASANGQTWDLFVYADLKSSPAILVI